jgi:hypothetical protein
MAVKNWEASRLQKMFLGDVRKSKQKYGVPFVDVKNFGDRGASAAAVNESGEIY